MSNVRYTQADAAKMHEKYLEGHTQSEVARMFGTTQDRVSSIFRKYGYSTKTNSIYHNSEMDKAYFRRIDRRDKAYFLGLVITDGNVRFGKRNELRLRIRRNDRYILEIFRHYLKTCRNVRDGKSGNSEFSELSITSVEFVGELKKYGIVQRKRDASSLPMLPSEFMPHLIRGILDGGGWISSTNRSIGFCGSQRLVSEVRDFLVGVLDVTPNRVSKDGSICKISWQNPTDFAKICAYLYEDRDDCYLLRKYYSFIDVMRYFSDRRFRIPTGKIRVRQFTADGEFVKEYENVNSASKTLGIHRQNILLCCKKKIRSCGGFVFRFNINDYFSAVPEKYRDKNIAVFTKV